MKLKLASLFCLLLTSCIAPSSSVIHAPAPVNGDTASAEVGATTPKPEIATNNAAEPNQGGFVGSPTDSSDLDPGPDCDAKSSNCTKANAATSPSPSPPDSSKSPSEPPPPGPPPPLPSSPEEEKPKETTQCEKATNWGLKTYHTILLHWKDGIALEWWKFSGSYGDQVKKALLSQFDTLIKDQPVHRTDSCSTQKPSNIPTKPKTIAIWFQDSSPVLPPVLDQEVTFHTLEEFQDFLSQMELVGGALKLPGK